MGKVKTGIYRITNKVNNKVYIGKSKSIYSRWQSHKCSLDNNYSVNDYLQNAWNKYGKENFIFEIIEECDINLLHDKECFWINYYDSCKSSNGYNILDPSKESFYGVDYNKKAKIKIYQIDKVSNIVINIYNSFEEAANFLKLPIKSFNNKTFRTGIGNGLKRLSYKGYFWVSENKYSPDIFYPSFITTEKRERKIPVFIINENNKIIEKFDYYSEVAKYLQKDRKMITEYIVKNIRVNGLRIVREKDYDSNIIYNSKKESKSVIIKLQNIKTQEIRVFNSQLEIKEVLGFNPIYLINGWKSRGGGIKTIISQWKGWEIYK